MGEKLDINTNIVLLFLDRLHLFQCDIAFFASSDMLVIDNVMDQFMSEVTVAECRAFYTLQAYIETIHSETYATALEIFTPIDQKDKLFNAVIQPFFIYIKQPYILYDYLVHMSFRQFSPAESCRKD